jgi:hypothetical protein
MADGGAPTEQFFEIDLSSGIGMHPLGGTRSMGANALYDLNNLMPDGHGLRRRLGVVPSNVAPTVGLNHPLQQRPVNVWIFPLAGQSETMVVLTTRCLLWRNTVGVWQDVTPVYATGTVSINNGSTALTGIGTAWIANAVMTTNAIIQLGATWYRINTVNSDVSITLSTPYAGANLVNVPYVAELCWLLETGRFGASKINPERGFAVRLNGTVYVCGTLGSDSNPSFSANPFQAGAILKLIGGADTGGGAIGAATFLTTGIKSLAGSTALGYTWFPRGFDVLEDGRLFMAVHWRGAARSRAPAHSALPTPVISTSRSGTRAQEVSPISR